MLLFAEKPPRWNRHIEFQKHWGIGAFPKGCYFRDEIKDGGYNNMNINKQLSPAQKFPCIAG